jgi:hypothetical protein
VRSSCISSALDPVLSGEDPKGSAVRKIKSTPLGHKTGPGALDTPTASQLDDETKTKCADKRAEALAILGSPSFEAASQG